MNRLFANRSIQLLVSITWRRLRFPLCKQSSTAREVSLVYPRDSFNVP